MLETHTNSFFNIKNHDSEGASILSCSQLMAWGVNGGKVTKSARRKTSKINVINQLLGLLNIIE